MFNKMKKFLHDNFKFPSKAWTEEQNDIAYHTPDMWKLEMHENQLVFLYDEYMYGRSQHKVLTSFAERMGTAFSFDEYTMWNYQNTQGITPVVMKSMYHINPARKVKGELYSLRPKYIRDLDILKQNGVQFRRKRIRVIVPSKPEVWVKERDGMKRLFQDKKASTSSWFSLPLENRFFDAWMYFGVDKYWTPKIDEDTDNTFQKPSVFSARNEALGTYVYFSHKDERK